MKILNPKVLQDVVWILEAFDFCPLLPLPESVSPAAKKPRSPPEAAHQAPPARNLDLVQHVEDVKGVSRSSGAGF